MPPAAKRPSGPRRAHATPDDQQASHSPFDTRRAFEAILEHSPLNLVVLDRDLVVRETSRPVAELARLTRKEMCGQPLRPDLAEHMRESFERVHAGEIIDNESRAIPEFAHGKAWLRVVMLPIRDEAGAVQGSAMVIMDVSEKRRAEELVEKLAFIDPLTELPNRAMLAGAIRRALRGSKAKSRQLALVWLNLDRFKDVNAALGHEAGDQLLRAVGERLRESVRASDMVARVGGDDFALLLPRINSREHLERLVGRVREVFAAPFKVHAEAVLPTASIGVVVHRHGDDGQELLHNAQTAMRAAKAVGGGACEVYSPGAEGDASGRLRLAGEIRDGIEQDHFRLHYQPQVHLETMSVQSVEALARWQHPERGLLAPGEFISFAEETGLIVPLGSHLLRRACGHHKVLHETLEDPPRLAINVSAREFQRTDVCGEMTRAAEAAGLSPSAFEIEITETAVLADPTHAAEVATRLRDAGATIALDDFGTGYSSLTHLRDLPIDRVKIDSSFVTCCLEDRSAAAILVGITHIAHDLGMEVVAEGVETQAQLDFVRAVGCDAAQGYHLARPLLPDECLDFLLRAEKGPVM